MNRFADILLAVVAVTATAFSLLGIPDTRDLDVGKFVHLKGHAYSVTVRSSSTWPLRLSTDDLDEPTGSSLTLFEDNRLLGPAHSVHDDIINLGNGRYSHWGRSLILSTSDNTVPNVNGRNYYIKYRWHLSWSVTVLFVVWTLWRRRRFAYAIRNKFFELISVTRDLFFRSTPRRKMLTETFVDLSYALRYSIIYILVVGSLSSFWGRLDYYVPQPISGGDQQLPNRFAHYALNRTDYDLIFLGDSRTYCGIHPEFIDPLLGTHSINLSSFSNWFPTQYAETLRLVDLIPRNTTVVLSVGHINFSCFGKIQRVFPINIRTALLYMTMGIPIIGLWDNVAFYNPFLHFWAVRGEFRQRFLSWMRSDVSFLQFRPHKLGMSVEENLNVTGPVSTALLSGPEKSREEKIDSLLISQVDPSVISSKAKDQLFLNPIVKKFVLEYASDPRVSLVDVNEEKGSVTSVTVFFRGGGYYRIEVDRKFFRQKQQSTLSDKPVSPTEIPSPPSACLALFSRILDAFRQRGINLIVNEIEEAPYTYGSTEKRVAFRDFMNRSVRPVVEAHGFRYITTQLDSLKDSDYFDYNHLNSVGIEKYAPMLASALRPLIKR